MKARIIIACLACLATVATASDKLLPRSDIFQRVIDCRAIVDGTQRLACYDSQVARLDEAAKRDEVVVVDKEQVKKARQGLFGFSLPNLGKLFGGKGGEDDTTEISEIESTILSAQTIGYGEWLIVLEDGARWQQVSGELALPPKKGQPIRIKRASMGSFMANVNKQPAIKVKRLN